MRRDHPLVAQCREEALLMVVVEGEENYRNHRNECPSTLFSLE